MSIHNCRICGKTGDIFTIEIPLDDGETFDQHICGSCWEIIAAICNRRINARIEKLDAQIARLLEAVPSAGVKK